MEIGVGVIGLGGSGLYPGKAFNEEPRSLLVAGVIGGRNSATIAIAAAESAEKGIPVDIPKCPIEKEE